MPRATSGRSSVPEAGRSRLWGTRRSVRPQPRPGTVHPITRNGRQSPGRPNPSLLGWAGGCGVGEQAQTTRLASQGRTASPRVPPHLPHPPPSPATHVQHGPGWRRTSGSACLPALSGRSPGTGTRGEGVASAGRRRERGRPGVRARGRGSRRHTKKAAGRRGGAGRGRGRQEGAGAARAADKAPAAVAGGSRCRAAGLRGLCRRRRFSPRRSSSSDFPRPANTRLRLGPRRAPRQPPGDHDRGAVSTGLRARGRSRAPEGREGSGRGCPPRRGRSRGSARRRLRAATLRPAGRLRGERGPRAPASGGGTFSVSPDRAASATAACGPGPAGSRGGTRAGSRGAARAVASRCARDREFWSRRGCCRSVLAGAPDPELGVPRYSRASPTPYFTGAPSVREDSYGLLLVTAA